MIYEGKNLKEISFPLGGIGTGSIGLMGNGGFIDWEIYNRPNKRSENLNTFFAVRAEYPDGKVVCKVLMGDYNRDFSGNIGVERWHGYGCGASSGSMCAYPHFSKVVFNGEFPVAQITFSDAGFPAEVVMTAFNPFIPLDSENSSLPAAFFDIKVKSLVDGVKYTVVFSVNNPFKKTYNEDISTDKYGAVRMKYADTPEDDAAYGDITIATDATDRIVHPYWYRGRWKDGVTTFWYELENHSFTYRDYNHDGEGKEKSGYNSIDVCSLGADMELSRGEEKSTRFVLSWNVPNYVNYWEKVEEGCKRASWRNYYATKFAHSNDTAIYALDNFGMLFEKTDIFRKSLHSISLDPVIIEAVSSTLSVLKTATVLRLEDGTFWAWEGLLEDFGSCQGTCTHVWSYAYALCFLFPDLERSIRDSEFKTSVNDAGCMSFRTRLPLAPYDFTRPCVDGQMATVFKTYREWKISGNDEWLRSNWSTVKRVLEFAWSPENHHEWDMNKDGVLEGRQHHTLDMELFGPSSWLESMYLTALKAAAEMAEYLGESDKAAEYLAIFESGKKFVKDELFNGKYFIQKVDLKNKEYTEHFGAPQYWNEEKNELKYQIGEGCEIDQALGQWHANILGLGEIFDKEQLRTALMSIYKNNFKNMREFTNQWRVFALLDESGVVMCDYPEDVNKPIIPLPYVDECMTGFEYAFAGLLAQEGFVDECIAVVRAIRERYDGEKRNPWNEIECGSNYARAMASFALLPIFSGFEYYAARHFVGFTPIDKGEFKCLWSLEEGWGNFEQTSKAASITLGDGSITLSSVKLGNMTSISKIIADGKEIEFDLDGNTACFEKLTVKEKIEFIA